MIEDTEMRQFDIEDIARVAYIAVNMVVDKLLPANASVDDRKKLCADAMNASRLIYNKNNLRHKMHITFSPDGMPQSYMIKTVDDEPSTEQELSFLPKFG